MPATIDLAHAGGTTGEWAGVLREVFGEYRAPDRRGRRGRAPAAGRRPAGRGRAGARRWPGGPPRLLVAKPGPRRPLATAPSRSPSPPATPAWRSSTRASGSRPSRSRPWPGDEDVDVVGLSILSGCHLELVPEVVRLLRDERRRRPGRRRRHHPRGRPAAACSTRASPPSTRRRTSSSPGSWPRSSTSPSPTATADRPGPSPGRHRSPAPRIDRVKAGVRPRSSARSS